MIRHLKHEKVAYMLIRNTGNVHRLVKFEITKPFETVGPFGERVVLNSGMCSGVLSCELQTVRCGSGPQSGYLVLFNLDIRVRDGMPWRFTQASHGQTLFFPGDEIDAAPSLEDFGAHLVFDSMFDQRDYYTLKVRDTGEVIHGKLYYSSAEIAIRFDETDMAVRIRWNAPPEHRFSIADGGATGMYRLSYEEVVFKRSAYRSYTPFFMYDGPKKFVECMPLSSVPERLREIPESPVIIG